MRDIVGDSGLCCVCVTFFFFLTSGARQSEPLDYTRWFSICCLSRWAGGWPRLRVPVYDCSDCSDGIGGGDSEFPDI